MNQCVVCGRVIPQGAQYCWQCAEDSQEFLKSSEEEGQGCIINTDWEDK